MPKQHALPAPSSRAAFAAPAQGTRIQTTASVPTALLEAHPRLGRPTALCARQVGFPAGACGLGVLLRRTPSYNAPSFRRILESPASPRHTGTDCHGEASIFFPMHTVIWVPYPLCSPPQAATLRALAGCVTASPAP